MRIPAALPFRFDFGLDYLARSQEEVLDVIIDGVHQRLINDGSRQALIEIQDSARGNAPAISACVLAGDIDEATLRSFAANVYRVCDDRSTFPGDDTLVQLLLNQFAGLPLVQAGSPYEALVWAIIGQQINVAFAYRVKRAFVEHFGEQLSYQGHTYYAFPTPERVVELTHDEHLRPIQFSRQKSRYILAVSEAVLQGQLDFNEIAELDDEAASAKLQEQIGVGRWTAEYVLLRGFGRRDVIPAGDAALKAALGVHHKLGRNATEEEVRRIAEDWRPYRGEIAFMIWFSLQHGWFHHAQHNR